MSNTFPVLRQSWRIQRAATLVLALSTAAACGDSYGDNYTPTAPLPPSTVLTATGDLAAKLVELRATLGEPNNLSTTGQQPAGRREVNWDGVPAAITNTDLFPFAF